MLRYEDAIKEQQKCHKEQQDFLVKHKPLFKTDQYRYREFYIPKRMMEVIERYVNYKVKPGSFLTAVIENDLKGAIRQADEENMANLPAFICWFYNEAPSACWGSKEKMIKWLGNHKETA